MNGIVRAVPRRSRVFHAALLTVMLAAGAQAERALASGSEAVGWGENRYGQLGGGFTSTGSASPVSVKGLTAITDVAAGYHLSLVLLGDGTVRAWGGNAFGQLGNGSREGSVVPAPVEGLSNVTAIAAGGAHGLALLSDGTVRAWGVNRYGQLGNGTMGLGSAATSPVRVRGLTGVVAIAAGASDSAALLSDGTVMTWGENSHGQLGDGTTNDQALPTPVRGLSGVAGIAVGDSDMIALTRAGTVVAWGRNVQGELGNGSGSDSSSPVAVRGLSGVVAISAGAAHNLALLSTGKVFAWGGNTFGQLGVGQGPEVCGNGTLKTWCSRTPVQVRGLASVIEISAGYQFSLALSQSIVSAWGRNCFGQLGDGTFETRFLPVTVKGLTEVAGIAAGEQHSMAFRR